MSCHQTIYYLSSLLSSVRVCEFSLTSGGLSTAAACNARIRESNSGTGVTRNRRHNNTIARNFKSSVPETVRLREEREEEEEVEERRDGECGGDDDDESRTSIRLRQLRSKRNASDNISVCVMVRWSVDKPAAAVAAAAEGDFPVMDEDNSHQRSSAKR